MLASALLQSDMIISLRGERLQGTMESRRPDVDSPNRLHDSTKSTSMSTWQIMHAVIVDTGTQHPLSQSMRVGHAAGTSGTATSCVLR